MDDNEQVDKQKIEFLESYYELLSKEVIIKSLYPYPFHTYYTFLQFDDIGYSDKILCLGCEIKSDY